LASSVWQGTLGQKFNVPLKEKTNFVWIGTKSYKSFLASFLRDFSATSVWHEKLRQTWPLTFGRKITQHPFDREQLKNVSLSVVGDFRHQLFFLTN
jgi:hypothetical protein